jgi:bifunctional UDP-N-acetylglucosamine pyrophosphorylase / glucosamine-1-phosphate N-acetyltransferase
MSLAVVILAAGQGTRMQSKTQKILHTVGGKPMVQHAFEAAASVSDGRPVLVVGPGEEGVGALLGDKATYVVQPQQLGTGHATQMAKPAVDGGIDQVLVTYGDMPLLRASTMRRLAAAQRSSGAAVAMLSVMGEADSSFGRVVRNEEGQVVEIVEVAEAARRENGEELLAITELNVGVYCFDGRWLWQHIDALPLRQARNGEEYYLTDMVEMAVNQGREVVAIAVDDEDECLGAGTRAELALVEKAFRQRTNRYWLDKGVTLIDPESTFIDVDVIIGQDTVIWPNSYLQGATTIGERCVIGPNAIVRQSIVGDGCFVEQAVIEDSVLPAGERVRPFSWIENSK